MNKQIINLIAMAFLLVQGCTPQNQEDLLWNHVTDVQEAFAQNDTRTSLVDDHLLIETTSNTRFAWYTLNAPKEGWDFSLKAYVEAEIANVSAHPAKILLWVHARNGWDAVCDTATIHPGKSKSFKVDLRETFPDGTPKINPNRIDKIELMMVRAKKGTKVKVENLVACGEADIWKMQANRLVVPDLIEEYPGARKRVKYQTGTMIGTDAYAALYLPENWNAGETYPVIVEFPGNIWFTKDSYSNGSPEACSIGYGMTKGIGAILINMPFLNENSNQNVVNGFGDPDYTAETTMEAVNEIIQKFDGDPENLFITGFSRGAIACGYIGLRNTKIASLWKGIHACQHFDGDGWGGANMEDARERIKNFNGSYFHTDNNNKEPEQMLSDAGVEATYVNSGLGAHATAMFLDDRESTQKLRSWYQQLIEE